MTCNKCQAINSEQANYCSACGNTLAIASTGDYNKHIKKISVFFFVLLAYIAGTRIFPFEGDYERLLFADSFFALIVIGFFLFNFKSLRKLFSFERLKLSILLKVIIFSILFAILIHFFATFLDQGLFNQYQISYYEMFIRSPAPLTLCIISIALFPAIFEEIAFRGILFSELSKMIKLKPTILLSTILFTLLHLSIISILWLLPGGLILGYLRAKHKTLWYGIIAHFLYNSSIVLIELIEAGLNR